jgi:hypothetical protein
VHLNLFLDTDEGILKVIEAVETLQVALANFFHSYNTFFRIKCSVYLSFNSIIKNIIHKHGNGSELIAVGKFFR